MIKIIFEKKHCMINLFEDNFHENKVKKIYFKILKEKSN